MKHNYNQDLDIDALAFLADPDENNTMEDLASHFGCEIYHLRKWRRAHPSFKLACDKGRELKRRQRASAIKSQKYTNKMPGRLLELSAAGKSKAEIAMALGGSHTMLQDWRKKYPEFKEAWELAEVIKEAYYDKLTQKAAMGKIKDFSAPALKMLKTTRFNYSDTSTVKGDANNPITQKITIEFVDNDDTDDE